MWLTVTLVAALMGVAGTRGVAHVSPASSTASAEDFLVAAVSRSAAITRTSMAGQFDTLSYPVTQLTPTPTTTLTPLPTLPIVGQLGACLQVTKAAWGFNNQSKVWLGYQPGAPQSAQNLSEFVPGGGYWVNVDADCAIKFTANNIPLFTGWNLFGWR